MDVDITQFVLIFKVNDNIKGPCCKGCAYSIPANRFMIFHKAVTFDVEFETCIFYVRPLHFKNSLTSSHEPSRNSSISSLERKLFTEVYNFHALQYAYNQ